MGSNKIPASDRLPAEFYKILWDDINQYLLNALNCAYTKGLLSITQRRGLITLITKKTKTKKKQTNKPANLLKTGGLSPRLATSRPHENPRENVLASEAWFFEVDLTRIPGKRFLASEAWFFGREADERATKSRDVDLARLQGFHLRFALKKDDVICNLVAHSPALECRNVVSQLRLK